jgi:CheY-like chemotaxis protein
MHSATKARILVVEDDFMNKVLVKEMLSLHGYTVIEASDGEEALAVVEGTAPDVVLMDLNMPKMDGVTATRLIKEKKGFEDLQIIALTASAMKGDEEMLLAKGFDGYVPKPIELSKLIAKVEEALKVERGGS